MRGRVVFLLLVGCGPNVVIPSSSTGEMGTDASTATAGGVTTAVPEATTSGPSTSPLPPSDTSTSTTSGTSESSTACDPTNGEDTVDLGECEPFQPGPDAHVELTRVMDDFRTIDIDAACEVTGSERREPRSFAVELSCPAESYLLDVNMDPPVSLAPYFTTGETVQVRAYIEGAIDSVPPTHVAIRNGEGDLLLAYSNYLPVPETVDPNYLDWFAPLTFSQVDLGCPATEPPEPSGCGFIVDPCPSGYELRGLEFSDGTDEVLVTQPNGGLLGPFDLRVRAVRVYPAPGSECADRPYDIATWSAFRLP